MVAVARRESEALAEAMRAAEGKIHFRACDLGDIANLSQFVRMLRADFGPLYGLVNNAGIGTSGVLATLGDAAIEAVVRINVLSPIVLTKYVVRAMMATSGSRIVNIGSIVGTTGYSGLAAYSATKAAMTGFTRSLARELGPLGITVNAVAPGFVATDMTEELNAGHRERIAKRSALRRMPEPEDVAAAVVFLLSDAARNITGTVTTVDAGNTA